MTTERANGGLKFLDRYLGIPLIWMLGHLSPRRKRPTTLSSLGIFKEACIGDTVLLAGILRDLRDELPQAHLTLFVGPSNLGVAKLLPEVDEIVMLPVTRPWSCLLELRRHPLDAFLDFGQWPRINAFYSLFARAKFKVGFRTVGQYRHFAYDAVGEHRSDRHEMDNFRAILSTLGIPARSSPVISPQGGSPESGRYVVFHAWPGGTLSHVREWSFDRWAELGRRVQDRGWKIVLTGARSDRDRAIQLERAIGAGRISNRAGLDSIEDVSRLLAGAGCVVSVNTGVMNLAASLGAPTIGLNGPTAEHRWGPLGPKAESVSVPYPQGGYLNLGFEYDGMPLDCMEFISVEEVWSRVSRILGEA